MKTPLAVLAQEEDQAGFTGHHDLAATLRQFVERMRRQIDDQLARARATASTGSIAVEGTHAMPGNGGCERSRDRRSK